MQFHFLFLTVKTAGPHLIPIKSYSKNTHPSSFLKWIIVDYHDFASWLEDEARKLKLTIHSEIDGTVFVFGSIENISNLYLSDVTFLIFFLLYLNKIVKIKFIFF